MAVGSAVSKPGFLIGSHLLCRDAGHNSRDVLLISSSTSSPPRPTPLLFLTSLSSVSSFPLLFLLPSLTSYFHVSFLLFYLAIVLILYLAFSLFVLHLLSNRYFLTICKPCISLIFRLLLLSLLFSFVSLQSSVVFPTNFELIPIPVSLCWSCLSLHLLLFIDLSL